MRKVSCLILVMSLVLSSCGKKSTIKNYVSSEPLRDTYNLTFPIEDSSLTYHSPLPGLVPIVGGILKFVGDVFARNTKMGQVQMSYIQPLPEIPGDILKSVRLKRFFFYMKPTKIKHERLRDTIQAWLRRYILDRGNPTFGFLHRLAVRLSSEKLEDPENYVPLLTSELKSKNDYDSLMKVFKENYRERMVDTEIATDLILLKYSKQTREYDTTPDRYGTIHYLEINHEKAVVENKDVKRLLADLKYFFMNDPSYREHFKRVLILESSLIVELKNKGISNQVFEKIMKDNAEKIERDYLVNFIDTCSELSCLELIVPDVNLVPIATKGNALKFDAILHAGRVPDSFKLKGFVEFEVKVDSPI